MKAPVLHGPDAAVARSRPWVGGPRSHGMKLTPDRVTGRRVVHGE